MADSSSSSRHLRSLLPQPTPPVPSSQSGIAQRKRGRIGIACDACRHSKAKCSGERPICRNCAGRGLQCHYAAAEAETRLQALKRKYEELESRRSPYEELFDILKSVSERDARAILGKLRSGTDVETLLTHVVNGDLLLQLSVTPETRYRYEFPYISTMPANLLADDNPYLDSFIYESAAAFSPSKRPEFSGEPLRRSNASSGSNTRLPLHDAERNMYATVYLKPFHAAEVVDPLVSRVKVSQWTSICNDDVLMRKLLNGWLHCEYQFTAAFQKDLFLEDLAAQREDFCSSLLVNIVLGYACVCYPQFTNRAQYWNPETLGYRFLAEAKRLWELHASVPRVTTIQAGILFNVFYNLCGLDAVGQAYRIQAIALARELRLLDSAIEGRSPRYRHGVAFAAWALFNWETLVGYSFNFAPLLSEPPNWQLPDPLTNAGWYGEIRSRYPLCNINFPLYFGLVFKARSQFRVIMNEVCQTTYSPDSEMTLSKANVFMPRLKSWYDSLSGPLQPKSIVLPGHLQLHMYYHHLILAIFKPLLGIETSQIPCPHQIVADATRFLQTLVRLYFLRHGYEAMDLFIVIPLVLAAYDCIDAIDKQPPASELETLRSTLILVSKGLYAQRRNHYLAEALFRVVRGRMRPAEVALFRGILEMDGVQEDEAPDMAQVVRSHWPISVVKKDQVDSYMLSNLVEHYAHLNVEEESAGQGAAKTNDT